MNKIVCHNPKCMEFAPHNLVIQTGPHGIEKRIETCPVCGHKIMTNYSEMELLDVSRDSRAI